MQDQLRLLFGTVLFGTFFGISFGEIQCQGKDVKLNETQSEQVKECLGYHGTTSIWKLPTKDFPCFGTCIFKVRGFLTEDGEEILKDKMVTHFTTVVHIEESKTLLEKLLKCADEHGKNL
ncbi:unnamed protein product, partial [Allacma fusca]